MTTPKAERIGGGRTSRRRSGVKRLIVLLGALGALAAFLFILRGSNERRDSASGPRSRAREIGAAQSVPRAGLHPHLVPAMLESADTISIGGTVRDDNGAAAPGAMVSLSEWHQGRAAPLGRPAAVQHARADAAGRYAFDRLPRANYLLGATARGHQPALARVLGGATERRHTVDLVVRRGGIPLTGTVFDVGGGPLGAAVVIVRGPGEFTFQAVSGEDGRFEIFVDEPRSYHVEAVAEGYAAQALYSPNAPADLKFLLWPAGSIVGRVVDARGERIAGAHVSVHAASGGATKTFSTTDAGEFFVKGLEPGAYSLSAGKDDLFGVLDRPLTLEAGETKADIEIAVGPGARVHGRVTNREGQPIGDATIRVRDAAGRSFFGARTDRSGRYATQAVPLGDLRVIASARGFQLASKQAAAPTTKPETVDFVLAPASSLRGRVVQATGAPVAGAQVTATVKTPEGGQTSRNRETGPDGEFVIEDVAAGTLRVAARHETYGPGAAEPVEVFPGAEAKVTVRLGCAEVRLAGTVTDSAGQALRNVDVRWRGAGDESWNTARARTDANGRFGIGPICPGRGTIAAELPPTSAGPAPRVEQPLTVGPGQEKDGIALVVPRGGGAIGGRVVLADGRPAEYASVGLVVERREDEKAGPSGGTPASTPATLTGLDGRFLVSDLYDGTYTVWAMVRGGTRAELRSVRAGSRELVLRLDGSPTAAGR